MEKNTVIEVEHVSMKFNLASEKYDSLKVYVFYKKQDEFILNI